jgi:hypothetical protein
MPRARSTPAIYRKVDGQRWLDTVTAAVVMGTYVDPKTAPTTVEQWCTTWLDGYATRRASTVRQAGVHVRQIVQALGTRRPLGSALPVRRALVDLETEGRRIVRQLRLRLARPALAERVRRGP